MYYEINVARNGRHLFATAPRSLTHREQAMALYREIIEKFPDCAVSIKRRMDSGTCLFRYDPDDDVDDFLKTTYQP